MSASVDASELFISVMTLHELEHGVLLMERRDKPQGLMLRRWLDQHVRPAFEQRILPVDAAVVLRSARLHVPDPKPINDALIAATAFVHHMTLVTRNTVDFQGMGLTVLNPWAATSN